MKIPLPYLDDLCLHMLKLLAYNTPKHFKLMDLDNLYFPHKPCKNTLTIFAMQVTAKSMDEKLGRMVTRVVLPRVIMHSRHHYGVSIH